MSRAEDSNAWKNIWIKHTEILAAVLQRIAKNNEKELHSVAKIFDEEFTGEYAILHLLSKDPLNEEQMVSIMDMLQHGVKPDKKNDKNQTFLETSSIKLKLILKIQDAPPGWIKTLWDDKDIIKHWINLKDDELLSMILKQMKTVIPETSSAFNPFDNTIAMKLWNTNLPQSLNQYLKLTAKKYDYNDEQLKIRCKNLNPDMALPFYEKLKDFTSEPPLVGYYIKSFFFNLALFALIIRCLDAITDMTLTYDYFNAKDSTLFDGVTNLTESLNISCIEEINAKTILCFPNEYRCWQAGALSIVVLLITYFTEVYFTFKEYPIHYRQLFSGACCIQHDKHLITAYGWILPMYQQVPSLLYNYWILSFTEYWKGKDFKIIRLQHCTFCTDACTSNSRQLSYKKRKVVGLTRGLTEDEDIENGGLGNLHNHSNTMVELTDEEPVDIKICILCSRNINESQLAELHKCAHKIHNQSMILTAATENTYMPLIQLAFIFPLLVAGDISDFFGEDDMSTMLQKVSDKKTFLLTLFSATSSLLSMATSQTAIYFASIGKERQKSLKNRIFVFIMSLLQVLPKVMACQVFAFGAIGQYNHDHVLPTLFCLPIILSAVKILPIWFISQFCVWKNSKSKPLTWKEIWAHLISSTFIFRMFEDVKANHQRNNICMNELERPLLNGNIHQKDTNSNNIKENLVFGILTQNGIYHFVFDVMSFLENCLLVTLGALFKIDNPYNSQLYFPSSWSPWPVIATVIISHLVALFLKCVYYQEVHPWMSLSDAFYIMTQILSGIYVIMGISIISAIFFAADYFASPTLYVLGIWIIASVNNLFLIS